MVTARIPSAITADSVARWPGPVIFDDSTGSFASMAVSTTRRPIASQVGDLAECAGRDRILRPRDLAQRRRTELGAEAQRLARDDDGLRRDRLLVRLEAAHAHLGLAVEPRLRDENRKQSEQDGEADHDDGADTHDDYPLDARVSFACHRGHIGVREVLNW